MIQFIRCRYYPQDAETFSSFDLAREGYFIQIGLINDESRAIVRDKLNNKIVVTFPDYIRFEDTVSDFLANEIYLRVEGLVAKTKRDEVALRIRKTFLDFGQ